MDALLRKALLLARERSGGPGGRMYVAALGNFLKSESATWDGKLTSLLRGQPEFCTLEGDQVLFGEGDLVEASQGSDSSDLWVKEPLYKAFLFSSERTASALDMETWQVEEIPRTEDGELGVPFSEEPWRYLEIPPWPTDEQIAFAAEKLGLDEDRLAKAGHNWAKDAKRLVPAPRWGAFLTDRRIAVVERALDFLEAHEVPKSRFIYRREASAPTPKAGQPSALRVAVHRAIDRMTDEELEQLPIPARLLVED